MAKKRIIPVAMTVTTIRVAVTNDATTTISEVKFGCLFRNYDPSNKHKLAKRLKDAYVKDYLESHKPEFEIMPTSKVKVSASIRFLECDVLLNDTDHGTASK